MSNTELIKEIEASYNPILKKWVCYVTYIDGSTNTIFIDKVKIRKGGIKMKFKKSIWVEDLSFKNHKEIYDHLISIFMDAKDYDEDNRDILCTIEEIEKYLYPLKAVLK